MSSRKDDDKKDKKSIIIILLLLILVAGGVFLALSWNKLFGHDESGGVGLYVDPNAGDYVAPEVESKPGVTIPGWGSFTIPPNTTELKNMVDFYNPEQNAGNYYLTFELRLPKGNKGEYEVLYTSGLIEPGKHVQTITIKRGLAAGEYNAVVHVQPYTLDDQQVKLNNADINTKIIVK